MKLNLACGRNVKAGWCNVDAYERENKLDVICDLTKRFPLENDSCEYVYCEQFIEHLDWIEGCEFLHNCYRVLKVGGTLRLVLPHYRKVFKKYLEGDTEFFQPFFDALNKSDLPYYKEVYESPMKIQMERKDNPPPAWHTSPRMEDRERVKQRVRHYDNLIDVVDYFCHQYQEHKQLLDFTSLKGLLQGIGFTNIKETEWCELDSDAPTRKEFSLYMEAVK